MRSFLPARLGARLAVVVYVLCASGCAIASPASPSPDHHEFDAVLTAPYAGRGEDDASREFLLQFAFPDAADPNTVAWRLEVVAADDRVVRAWHGESRLYGMAVEVNVPWDGTDVAGSALAAGFYRVRLSAIAGDPVAWQGPSETLAKRVDAVLVDGKHGLRVQEWDIQVGRPPRPKMPRFAPMPVGDVQARAVPAVGALPFTVYFGNLHSQTNHSDGGGEIPGCSSSQSAQSGEFGPADAYAFARNRGLDYLVTSEHNHYFDGSSGTNGSANRTTVLNLYQSGLTAASAFNTANPGFLAIYGLEWGVIENGGHLNIFNANELIGWENNSSGQLLANTFTAKSDYAALYALMQSRGWIGQFNHPDSTGQFRIGGTDLAFNAAGDAVMVLAEIMNTSAFSSNTTETETSRSSYSGAFNKLLERGFHVAPATNQDNHCANWGASYTNRTGVLIPSGTTLGSAAFLDALRARRVFATEDKTGQLVLTGNGHLMGERFANSGALTLTANFASTGGKTVSQVQLFRGVPGRNGTVTQLANTATHTFTPANGEHFFYAKVTQNDGKVLWSAPLWVTQGSGPPPVTPVERVVNGGYESGSASWTASSGVITNSSAYAAHGGSWKAWLNGYGSAHTDTAFQAVAIPAAATNATLSFWLRVDSDETGSTAFDTLKAQLRSPSNTVLTTLATYSNVDESGGYVKRSFDVTAFKGQTVRVYFEGIEGSIKATSFLVDDVSLVTQ